MKHFVLLFLLSSFAISSIEITKEWLQTKPRSYAKDFYIWRYLDQDITPQEAIWALGEANRVNNKLFFRYAKKLNHKETSRVVQCMRMDQNKLVLEDNNCIELGLSAYKATKLSRNQRDKLIDQLQEQYPQKVNILKIINSPIAFQILTNSDTDTFYDTFLQVGGKFRAENFNYHLPKKTISKLKKDKKNFQRVIRKIVIEPRLTKLQQSLLHIQSKELNHHSTFYLAINAIKHKEYKNALEYLKDSYNKAYYMFDKDKVLFWQYKLTQSKEYLQKLSNSWDINIYSLYAKETLNKKIDNLVFDFETDQEKSDFNTSDPFAWLKVLNDSKNIDSGKMEYYKKLFNTQETSGHLAFVQERFSKYQKGYFPTPYKDLTKNYTKQRTALINAIARQESRFIPTSISHSYAQGVMQIMPFLSRALAKQMDEEYDIDKQLEAKTNIRYAHKHLDWLEKQLKHPLLIAYAYNGGIGFTKRMLKSGIFKKGKFEPFLSMELVPYDESKKYGKKVLANYIIYYNQTHEKKIHVTSELEKLRLPFPH